MRSAAEKVDQRTHVFFDLCLRTASTSCRGAALTVTMHRLYCARPRLHGAQVWPQGARLYAAERVVLAVEERLLEKPHEDLHAPVPCRGAAMPCRAAHFKPSVFHAVRFGRPRLRSRSNTECCVRPAKTTDKSHLSHTTWRVSCRTMDQCAVAGGTDQTVVAHGKHAPPFAFAAVGAALAWDKLQVSAVRPSAARNHLKCCLLLRARAGRREGSVLDVAGCLLRVVCYMLHVARGR